MVSGECFDGVVDAGEGFGAGGVGGVVVEAAGEGVEGGFVKGVGLVPGGVAHAGAEVVVGEGGA